MLWRGSFNVESGEGAYGRGKFKVEELGYVGVLDGIQFALQGVLLHFVH